MIAQIFGGLIGLIKDIIGQLIGENLIPMIIGILERISEWFAGIP